MTDQEFDIKYKLLRTKTVEHPEDGLAWANLGKFIVEFCENARPAVTAFRRAQDLLPEKDFRLPLARAYARTGQYEKALELAHATAAARPRARAHCVLAEIYCSIGPLAKAKDAAQTAIDLEPSFEEGHYWFGEALFKLRDWDGAAAAYRTAISIDGDYSVAWQGLGQSLMRLGKSLEAVDAYRKAVELDPEDMWSMVFLANGLWTVGQLDEADKKYQAAIALAPDDLNLRIWYDDFLAVCSRPLDPPPRDLHARR